MSLSDMVVLMQGGRVEQMGTPRALYERPVSTFAAGFVGDPPMALVEGAALGAPGVLVGIRPEHLALTAPGAADIAGTVREVEYLGADTQIVIDHKAARGLVLSVPGHAAARPGETVGLSIPEEHRVLFDAETGRAEKDPQQDYGADHRQTAPRDSRKAPTPHLSTD